MLKKVRDIWAMQLQLSNINANLLFLVASVSLSPEATLDPTFFPFIFDFPNGPFSQPFPLLLYIDMPFYKCDICQRGGLGSLWDMQALLRCAVGHVGRKFAT